MKTCALLKSKQPIDEELSFAKAIYGRKIVAAQREVDGYTIYLDNNDIIVVTGNFAIGLLEFNPYSIN